jgi:quercetin dioxygenase-like cupin family protein
VEVLARAGIPGFLPDQSGSSPAHSHTAGQEEEVTVINGKLGYLLGGSDSNGELGPGQTITIPAGESNQ